MIDSKEEKKNTQKVKEAEVTDVNLGYSDKKKFRINGDYSRILELNISDLNAIGRYNEAYPKLLDFMSTVQKELATTDDDDTDLTKLSEVLTKIDKEMRDCIDYIFDTNASEVCAPSGNMFDPVGGKFRYEHIIETLSKLYAEGISSEFDKMKKNTAKYTTKYTKKKK